MLPGAQKKSNQPYHVFSSRVAVAAAPPHAPMAAAATFAAASITCSSSSYEDDGGATSSWSLSSPRRRPYRRLLHDEAQRLRRSRRSQGPGADTPRWVRRTTDQMARYVEDDRAGHVYGRHVVAAVRAVRATASRPSADMRQAMASFVTKLTFREMCVVLREQRGWRQARDFFAWMKLQLCYEPSVVAYTILLRLYGRVGKIKLAEETFLEMLEAGCEPDAVACGTLLCAYARWGRHKDMMLFYSAVRRRDIVPPISVFNYMISSLQKQKLHAKVIHVWKQMREANVAPNQFTYTVVISSYAKENLLEEAMDAFAEMRKHKFVPEEATYSLLISLSSKHGKGEQALQLFEEMRDQGIVPSNYTCASLLALYYKNEDYSKALSLFSAMEHNKIIPDEVIYGILVRIYGKLGLYEDAQHTFEEIEKAGLLSDEQTYVAMAQVHMNVGNYDRAMKVLESMQIRNVKPSYFSYSALLRCYVAKEDMASAEDTFKALPTYGLPDVFCCNDLLRLYMRLGHLEKAGALILKMREEDFQFDEDLCMTVMEFYCKSNMIEDAEKLFNGIQRNGKSMKVTTMFFLIEMYARNRISMIQKEEGPKSLVSSDSSAASMVFKSLLDMSGGLSSACQLISRLAREGNKDEAKFLYEQLSALGAKPDGSALATLIVQYGQDQQLEQAQELFESASASSSVGGHVYNAMVDALCKCGKIDKAYDLFVKMADQRSNRDAVTISILVTHLTKHGKFQEAENIVHGCFRDEVQLDTVAYNTFIKLMLESGKLHSAVSIYGRMISSGISPSMQTFNIMISVYGKGGKLDKAIETFASAQELGLAIDEKTYTNMLSLYGKAGRHQEASLLFSRMKQDGIKPGKISYNSMINACATSGLHSEARTVFQEMRDSGHAPDSLSYLALIRAYTEGKRYKEAEEAIRMMLGSNITASCAHFNHLIFAFLKEGQISEAQRICNQMKEMGVAPDLACCRTMMRVYLERGLADEGISLFETTRGSLKPDSYILSAAFHLYEHEGREPEAGEVLDAIGLQGTTFLRNMKVGSKLSLIMQGGGVHPPRQNPPLPLIRTEQSEEKVERTERRKLQSDLRCTCLRSQGRGGGKESVISSSPARHHPLRRPHRRRLLRPERPESLSIMQSPSKITDASVSTPPDPSTPQGWAGLREGLLHSIIPLLGSFLDLLAFAGSCRSWHAAFASYPSKSTFRALLPPLLVRPNVPVPAPHLPSIRDGHKLRTCQVVDPANPNTALRCQIPQEALQKKHFAGISYGQLICGRRKDCLVVDVFTGARVSPPRLPFVEDTDFYCGMLTAPLTSPNSHLLMCTQSNGNPYSCQYSLLDWPVGSDSWSELRLHDARIHQIVDFNGQLIAMDFHQRLYTVSLAPNLALQQIVTVWWDGMSECPFLRPWLVVCGNMLLMVDHYVSFSFGAPVIYKAYRLNMSTNPATWAEVERLENYSLFIGADVRSLPFSCMSPGRWGGRSNCLYYAHNTQPWSLHGLGGAADAVWDDSNDPELVFKRNWYGQLQPFWLYPSMFYNDGQ